VFLGEMIKGKIRKEVIILCPKCGEKAKIAMEIANLAAHQSNEFLKGNKNNSMQSDPTVEHLMGLFGMK
jgi:hypothetical protein